MIKKLQYIGIIGVLLTILSCEKEYQAPGSAATKYYVTLNKQTAQIHEPIDFGDMSSGLASSEWTFPEGITDILGSDNDVTSTNPLVHATFSQPGWYQVRLRQTYGNPLIDNGPAIDSGATEVDTIFTIHILDSVKAKVTANYVALDGSDSTFMELKDNALNELMAGEYVRFSFTGEGVPSDFIWDSEGASPDYVDGTDSTILIQYKQIGVYSIKHIAYRTSPEGSDTISFTNFLKVVSSSRPVNLVQILKQSRTELALDFSRSIKTPDQSEISNFTVSVSNGGVDYPVNVSSIAIDPDATNLVLLTLDAEVYDDDNILVSYNPGELISEDGKKLDAFANVSPISIKTSILTEEFNGGFENQTSDWSDAFWGDPWDKINYVISTDYYHSGSKSLCLIFGPGDGGAITNRMLIPFEEGVTYEVSGWFYVSQDASSGSESSIAIFNSAFDGNHCVGRHYNATEDWYQIKKEWDPGATELSFFIRGGNIDSTDPMTVYFDDFDITIVDKRPE